MTAILLALAVVALVVYGLERNHRRQRSLAPRLAGSPTTDDRDLSRVHADLRAAARPAASGRGTPAATRPAGRSVGSASRA